MPSPTLFHEEREMRTWFPPHGDITQKGYEKKRGKLLAPYIPQIQGVDPSLQTEPRISASSQAAPLTSKHNKPRAGNSRDERFRSDLHTEAVQAALAKYKERKMPMPSKRRSVLVQSSVEACTPPVNKQQTKTDTSSASEDEGRMASSSPFQAPNPNVEHWFNRVIHHCSSTSSSASSTSSYPGGRSHHSSNSASNSATAATVLADVMAHTQLGVPVNSRVSSKIQQLLNTLKRPKRPPLREFFVDDFEELLDVQQPDPNQPKPEGVQMTPLHGELLDVGTKWPLSLLASLQRWGTTHPKSPCLTSLDNTGKPIYTLTYGKLWTRSQKLAYTLLNKLSSRNEPLLRPGDRVALVFPNNDPVMFMVAFYGCLLAELVPVPIEVPLTRKDAGSQQIGFLLGSCGVTLALTTDVCQKGLPKAHTGEVATFKGSSTMGITVSHAAMLAHCHALTQACGYIEGVNLLLRCFLERVSGSRFEAEVICPCASSAEALTVAIAGLRKWESLHLVKAVLSMSSLSHGVIRVVTEEKLAVLTLQDVGQTLVCVVRPEGTPYLCKTDEVGELCVSSCTTGVSYFGLPGITKNVFEDDLLFVVGKMDGLMVVSGRRHNADDVVATALAVEPMKFVYRGRIAVFSVCVLHDERIVVVAEQRPDASEEDSFQWMSRVLQAIDSIHRVGVYCLALVPANTLPKAALGGIHVSETKQRFLDGALHPCTVLMSPHTCITNLPKPRQKQPVYW
ncbi:hypothetical protein QTP86_010631 [Hemibagrus guttatus]|nr:hypothetical protein QTP86_010631 [Hemibagrus guttatus]